MAITQMEFLMLKTISNIVISHLQGAIVDTPLGFTMSSIHIALY